jgi:hypothetical protein
MSHTIHLYHFRTLAVRDAWGSDEYHPVSQQGSNLTSSGGIGYMIIDALDTMHIMGLTSEYEHARLWIAESLSFDRPGNLNAFEVTIRVLGGLLSAYHLSLDTLFLDKAIDLADRIMPIFATPSGIPVSFIDLKERQGRPDKDNNGWSSLSEVATLQLELKYLSHLTDDYTYWRAAEKVKASCWFLPRSWTVTRATQVLEVIKNAGHPLLPIFIRYARPLLPVACAFQSKHFLPDPKTASSSVTKFDSALAVTRTMSTYCMSYPYLSHSP